MVILWTQLDGGKQDPSERLAAEAQDTGPEHKNVELPATSTESPLHLEHPKVEGRPPSGRKTSKSSSLSPPGKTYSLKISKSGRVKKPVEDVESEKCVVSIKDIPFPKAKTSSTSPEGTTDSLSGDGESPRSVISLNGSPPLNSGTTKTPKSISLVDSCKVRTITNETPTKVTFRRNGTLKYGTLPESPCKIPDFDEEVDAEVDSIMNSKRRSLKRFYTLPRNWKAADIFRTKGCFGRKASPEPSHTPPNTPSSSHTTSITSSPYPNSSLSPTRTPADGYAVKGVSNVQCSEASTTPSRKTFCEHCKKKCSGEVLRVHEKYFHIVCFNCTSCKKSLAQGGFFSRENNYFCTDCYQGKFGQQCATCGKYVEGEVVSALGNTYHQKCFLCARCRQPFPSGERVTYTGKECLCQRCYQIPTVDSESPARSPTSIGPKCAGCKEELVEGQALIALDQQWHIWCFKCAACHTLLHGEYMGKDGLPYCEKDYQSQFGVKCAYCDRFITGKVLQAGDNHHFHPTCARCTKCGDPFGDGEEMYLQGTAIWHPRCGPGPTENGTVINGSLSNGHHVNGEQKPSDRDRDFDGLSSTASETQFSRSCTPSINGSYRSFSPYNSLTRKFSGPYRTCSPGLILREYKSSQSPVDITRIYTYSYLAAEPTQSYLKRPIDPYDKPPKSPHFHRPPSDPRKVSLPKASSRLGMRVLVDTIQSETPRPKSPKMNNEEPIILSHFPAAKPPPEGQTSRIERDDFPAPPYPYTDPERRRRWSGSSKGVSVDETDDALEDDEVPPLDPKLKKEEVELSKIATGIGKVFLQQVKEREKIRAWKAVHIDPRNASRTPSANREPAYKMRFESSVNASPSRHTDHSRPWDEDDFDPASSYRCSTGRSSVTIPSYNVVSSLRGEPKPGYGLKASTLPSAGRNGGPAGMIGDYTFNALGEKTHSTDFSSARSDVSASSLTEADRTALNAELCPSSTYSSGLRGYSYSPHFRRSLPNMHHMASDPPKIYPAHLLFTTNYRLPNDVDRCHLERHLSDADFEMVFHMTRLEFYRLPEWKRNDIKRRARMF